MTTKKYPRGSEWCKWDLHIHSPYSICQDYGGPEKFEDFICALEALPADVKVIGINDYYFIDGYEKTMAYKKQGRLPKIEKIFPVLEFRIDTFASASESKFQKINLHILFDLDENSLEAEIRKVREEFISQIHLSKAHPTQVLSKENLIQYSSDKKIKSGFSELVPSTDEVFKLLETKTWKNKVFLILGYTEWNNLNKNEQLKNEKRELYKKADAFFTASITDDMSKKEDVLYGYGKKPLLHSLDIRSCKTLSGSDYKCYTWIKANPTFDGLRQIIFETDERIKIQKEISQFTKAKLHIERAFLDNCSNFPMAEGAMPLNSGLVAIIGGRGSGKSALAETIAFVFGQHATKPINNKKRFIPFFDELGADFKMGLNLVDREGSETEYCRSLSKPEEPCSFPFVYLGQNQIEEISTDDDLIHSLVSEKILIASGKSSAYLTREEEGRKIHENILDILSRIYNIDQKISEIKIEDVNKQRKQYEQEKKLLVSKETKDAIGKLNEAKIKNVSAQQLKEKAGILKERIEQVITELNLEYVDVVSEAAKLGIMVPEAKADTSAIENNLQTIIKAKVITDIGNEFAKVEKETKKVLQGNTDISVDRLNFLTEEVTRLTAETDRYEELKKARAELITNRNSELRNYFNKFTDLEAAYQEAIQEFGKREDVKGILQGVNFEAELLFQKDSLMADLYENHVDKRRCKSLDAFNQTLGFSNAAQFTEWVIQNADQLEQLDVFYGASLNKIKTKLFGKHFKLRTKVSFDVDGHKMPLPQLSLGLKGTVVLKLYLATENAPILFDQPEDHLDNKFISSNLVPTFKEAKKNRQILVVTHNANLVVNGDAEQVIIANYSKGEITYQSGALEDPAIKAKCAELLEGGEEAFQNRERKYGFPKRAISI